MIDEMGEDKITQDLQCFQSSLANSPHNDILWTCLVFLAASGQVWTIYWIIHPGLAVSHFIMVLIRQNTKKVIDCCHNECLSATFLTSLPSPAPCNLSLWHERRHPAPSPGDNFMTSADDSGVTWTSSANQRPGSRPGDQ